MRYILLSFLILGACTKPEPLRIPVPVKCINPSDIPPEVEPTPIHDDARQTADALAATVLKLRAADRVFRAIIQPCLR